jgi:uncharacterized Rmd1/YagE family protein
MADGSPFEGRERIEARAWFVGDRIDVRRLERGESLAVSPLTVRAGQNGCAMLFRNGMVILFGLEPAEEASFLHHLAPFVTGAFEAPESESAELVVAAHERERVDGGSGALVVHDLSLPRLQVVAQILAKSAVLSHYEEEVASVFQHIEPLAESLRDGGGSGQGSELLRRLGDVMLVQTHMVGRFEVTEKPEIAWERADLDRLYERLGVEYELDERDRALNRKLDVISTTAGTLLELDQNRRALRVEWYIVILILVEILMMVYDLLA